MTNVQRTNSENIRNADKNLDFCGREAKIRAVLVGFRFLIRKKNNEDKLGDDGGIIRAVRDGAGRSYFFR